MQVCRFFKYALRPAKSKTIKINKQKAKKQKTD